MKNLIKNLFIIISVSFSQLSIAQGHYMDCEEVQRVLNQAECLCSADEVSYAIDSLAHEINQELSDKNPVVLCVLKGAIVVTGKLLPKLNFPLELDYIHASRYKRNQGYGLKMHAEPQASLEGRSVLIVDDIIDEGLTLSYLIDYCKEQGAKEVYSAVLVDKNRERATLGLQKADFVGLHIPNKFIIGEGLDFEGYLRNMSGIFIMPEDSSL